jgi:hypothetical protein
MQTHGSKHSSKQEQVRQWTGLQSSLLWPLLDTYSVCVQAKTMSVPTSLAAKRTFSRQHYACQQPVS